MMGSYNIIFLQIHSYENVMIITFISCLTLLSVPQVYLSHISMVHRIATDEWNIEISQLFMSCSMAN